jgi:hypothetical protein
VEQKTPLNRFKDTRDVNHPSQEKIMNMISSGLLAATMSALFAASAALPASAASFYVPRAQSASSDVQTVEARNGVPQWIPRQGNRNFNGNRNFGRNSGATWNGHRGYHEYHRGYRRHGDYWFPLAAFATGALITGAIINNEDNSVYDEGDAHVQWCYDHYRSYRASDDTFQPNYGPRQQCDSPY